MPREDRADTVQAERRRRRDDTLNRIHGQKLSVEESLKAPGAACDPAKWVTRWVNDRDTRMYEMTQQDDWERVPTDDSGTDIRRPVGQNPDGSPLYAILCRKPLEFAQEDAAKRESGIKAKEEGIMRSKTSDPQDNRPDDVSYAVAGNTIKRGAYAP